LVAKHDALMQAKASHAWEKARHKVDNSYGCKLFVTFDIFPISVMLLDGKHHSRQMPAVC
jgi:hypothetical protein